MLTVVDFVFEAVISLGCGNAPFCVHTPTGTQRDHSTLSIHSQLSPGLPSQLCLYMTTSGGVERQRVDPKPLPVANLAMYLPAREVHTHQFITSVVRIYDPGDLLPLVDVLAHELCGHLQLQRPVHGGPRVAAP